VWRAGLWVSEVGTWGIGMHRRPLYLCLYRGVTMMRGLDIDRGLLGIGHTISRAGVCFMMTDEGSGYQE
jgi:hypothetical protein